jgi:superfamily II DNA or RNA helicase
MTIRLRDYQNDAVAAAHRAHGQGVRRPAEVLATGAGKSVIIAEIARTSRHGAAGGKRTVIVAHREELVEQNAQKVRDVAPDLRTGVVMAGRNETQGHVISASVQTLASPLRRSQLRDVGLVVIDEAHHAAADTYLATLRHFGCYDDGARALGFTATMKRGDMKALGDVWQDVVYVKETSELIAEGYLVRPIGVRVRVEDLDLRKVRRVAGDYTAAGLGREIEDSLAPKKIVEAMREHAADRQTILFAPLVHTAEVIRDALREGGFTAEVVSAKTPRDERKRLVDAYRDGKIQILCNAMVFTEGTDLPMTSCVVIARPTQNPALFVQMVGRGLRLWPDKTDCIVLDVVGATGRHRLAAPVELWGEEGLDREEIEALPPDDLQAMDDTDEQDDLDALFGMHEPEPQYRDGKLVHEVVDLFEGSDAGWMRTYAGVWFLATATRYVAVLPRVEGGYAVVSMHKARLGESAWIMERVSEIGTAMAHATGDIPDNERGAWLDFTGSGRSYIMRRARDMGIVVPEGATAGEIKKMITVGLASSRIDANLPGWVRR